MTRDLSLLVADAMLAGWRFRRPADEYFDLTRGGVAYLVVLDDDGGFDVAVRYRSGWLADGARFGSLASFRADVFHL